MADILDTQALPPTAPSASLVSTTLLIFTLYGIAAVAGLLSSGFPLIAPFFGVLGIVAVIIAYVKRTDAAGTWLASHYRWLIRTFWFSMLWAALGMLILVMLGLILIGIPDCVRDLVRGDDLDRLIGLCAAIFCSRKASRSQECRSARSATARGRRPIARARPADAVRVTRWGD